MLAAAGVALLLLVVHTSAFITPRSTFSYRKASLSRLHVERDKDGNVKKGPLEFLMDPKPTKIPKELRDEIYKAEENTEAAKQRKGRVAILTVVAVILVLCAFFNVFLTELRGSVAEEAGKATVDLDEIGFGWIEGNFLLQFLFANKIGGALAVMGGASAGMLVEAEMDGGRQNAEKIYEELARRKAERAQNTKRKSKRTKKIAPPSKKKQSAKQKKRLAALSEVVLEDPTPVPEPTAPPETSKAHKEVDEQKEGGIIGQVKEWYDKADSMAASQALLLNKELEDRGVLEKITDDTGLKVIGKDAAGKLQEDKAKDFQEEQ